MDAPIDSSSVPCPLLDPALAGEHGHEEARLALLDLAYRRTGSIPAGLLADHVLAVTRPGDWPVIEAAMGAVLRRIEARERDDLRVAERPPRALGRYSLRRPREGERPYRTELLGLQPLVARCDCPDFLRNGLGVCKHALAVLEELGRRPRRWKVALGERAVAQEGLTWDPVRPLHGRGDWLEQVRWRGEGSAPDLPGARWRRVAAQERRLEPLESTLDEPGRRAALVEALAVAHQAGSKRRRDLTLGALLVAEEERLRARPVGPGDLKALRATLRTLARRLYPYQREGVERFLERGRLLLADDMGLGKTTQAIAGCHALWRAGRVTRGLVVVPASLKPQWLREWQAATDAPAAVVDGTPGERRELFARTQRGFLIVNYEQVMRDLDVMRAWAPDLVVLDEAQRIKNQETKTAASVGALRPAYRLALTGTPMENRLDELASILEWVDERALAPRWRLGPLHLASAVDGTRPDGARHLSTVRARLQGVLLRRARSEVLTQLPGRTDTTIPAPPTAEQAAEHDALQVPIQRLAQVARRRPLTRPEFLRLMALLTRQRIIANGLAQLRFEQVWPTLEGRRPTPARLGALDAPKLAELRALVEQVAIQQGRKLVVFSQWRRMLTLAHWATQDLLEGHGLRAVFFTGREGQRRRTQNLIELHDDPSTRVLFATDAGGVGLNLQRAATCCVNLELPWNPAVLEQRVGRIHRLGQAHPIDVYHLVAPGTIEARIAALVGDKRALFRGLFEGTSDEVRFDGAPGLLHTLERVLAPESMGPGAQEAQEEPAARGLGVEPLAGEPAVVEAAAKVSAVAPSPSAGAIRALMKELRVSTSEGGALRLEAPPAAAASLAAMLEGLAALLRAGA